MYFAKLFQLYGCGLQPTSSSVHHKVITFEPCNFHFIAHELCVLHFIGHIQCSISLRGWGRKI
jgi:hypothetical protein